METNLMMYKIVKKCQKEEVLAGAQFAVGAPYLLNMFLDDYKDSHELGTEFHYSWLIMLIALIRWKEPTYSYLCYRVG
jgi:hypothetical protein